jgi:hypothetical protein
MFVDQRGEVPGESWTLETSELRQAVRLTGVARESGEFGRLPEAVNEGRAIQGWLDPENLISRMSRTAPYVIASDGGESQHSDPVCTEGDDVKLCVGPWHPHDDRDLSSNW